MKDPRELLLIPACRPGKNQYTYYLCHARKQPATLTYFITIAETCWPPSVKLLSDREDALVWTSPARTRRDHSDTALTALAQLAPPPPGPSPPEPLSSPRAPAAPARSSFHREPAV